MKKFKRYFEKDLPEMTKAEVFKGLDNFDFALPQNWLNDFVDWSHFDYSLVLSTTVWSYVSSLFGMPVSCCIEVQNKIDEYENL
jgi:hypothetical protein